LEQVIPRTRAALPFGVSNALYFGYVQLGTFILTILVLPSKVGAYFAAFRIIVLVYEFPIIVFSKTLLPLMFKSYKHDINELKRLYVVGARYMCGIGVIFSCGLCVYAKTIMTTVYGRGYEDGIVVLQILALGVGIRYLSLGVEATLTAIDRMKEKVAAQAITVACFVVLNFLLIPRYSLAGAAAASVITELVLLSLLLWNVSRFFITLSPIRDLRLDRLGMAVCPLAIGALALRGNISQWLSLVGVLVMLPFVLRASKYIEWHFVDRRLCFRQSD
jgi:O-antigen/teichoic acid export membrane protein